VSSQAPTPAPTSPQRFFARLRSFELACPGCDHTEAVGELTPARIWEPRLARYACPECGATYYLGVVAWAAARGGRWAAPEDQRPTKAEAHALRRRVSIWVDEPKTRAGARLNRVEGELPED
jgi:hypothetical protein